MTLNYSMEERKRIMAKKNALAIQNMTALLTEHGAALKSLGINADALTTMRIVKETNKLKAFKTAVENEREMLVKELEGIHKGLRAEINKFNEKQHAPGQAEFISFCRAAKVKKPDVQVDSKYKTVNGVLKVEVQYMYTSGDDRSHFSHNVFENKPLTAAMKKLIRMQEKTDADISTVNDKLSEIRCALQNIGEMERNAKASTTHALLSQTEEGAAILTSLGLEDLS